MKPILDLQRPLAQHFKTIAPAEVPGALRWFDDQRLGDHWCLTTEEQMALLGNVSPLLYDGWFDRLKLVVYPRRVTM